MTDPAAAAQARVEALLTRMSRIDLQVVMVAPPDTTRLAARDRARNAALAAGRGALFDEAAAVARETTLRSFSRAGFSGTWAATDMSVSVASAGDRVAAAAAFEEAAMAEVVEDLVDEHTLDVLHASSGELDRLTGLPSPGSLSSLTGSAGIGAANPAGSLLLVGLVIAGAAVWLLVGAGLGILTIALGIGAAAWLSRQRTIGR